MLMPIRNAHVQGIVKDTLCGLDSYTMLGLVSSILRLVPYNPHGILLYYIVNTFLSII